MKKLILFGVPFYFASILLFVLLDWLNIYENQLNEVASPLIFYLCGGLLLFLWFYYATKERLTGGYYNNHFIISLSTVFLLIISGMILFSDNLIIVSEGMINFSRIVSLVGEILGGVVLTAFFCAAGDVMAEKMVEVEARMRQRGINSIKAF